MKALRALIVASLLWPLGAGASDYLSDFNRVKATGDEKMVEAFLVEAGKTQAGNADYYATAANYWWQVSQSVDITTRPAEGGDYSVRDKVTGAEVGSISTTGRGNPELPKRALETLTEGVRLFPQRVDMALGLAHIQYEMERQKACVSTLLKLLATAKKDPEELTWTRNAQLPSPAGFLIPEAIQKYTHALYREETPAADALCIRLCDATIATFPDHAFAYNVRAAMAAAQGQPAESLSYLEKASAKAPDDALILMNLGDSYAKANESAKARATYTKVLQLAEGDESLKEQAGIAITEIDQSNATKSSSRKTKD